MLLHLQLARLHKSKLDATIFKYCQSLQIGAEQTTFFNVVPNTPTSSLNPNTMQGEKRERNMINHEQTTYRRNRQPLKPMIIRPTRIRIIRLIQPGPDRRIPRRESQLPIRIRDQRLRRSDRHRHLSFPREVVDVRSIFVRDPVRAVPKKNETFLVQGRDCAVPGCLACREDGEAIASWDGVVGVEACSRLVAFEEERGVLVVQGQVLRGVGDAVEGWGEGEFEFVDAGLVVDGAFGVPAAVGSREEGPLDGAVCRQGEAGDVWCGCRAEAAQRVSELVSCISGDCAVGYETAVDVGDAAAGGAVGYGQ